MYGNANSRLFEPNDNVNIVPRPAGHRGGVGTSATQRLALLGPNRLPEPKPRTLAQIAVRQFKSPLIYILALAGVLHFCGGVTSSPGP